MAERTSVTRSFLGDAATRLANFLKLKGGLNPELAGDAAPQIQPVILVGDVGGSGWGTELRRFVAGGIINASSLGISPGGSESGILLDRLDLVCSAAATIQLLVAGPGSSVVAGAGGQFIDGLQSPNEVPPILQGAMAFGAPFEASVTYGVGRHSIPLNCFLTVGMSIGASNSTAANVLASFHCRTIPRR